MREIDNTKEFEEWLKQSAEKRTAVAVQSLPLYKYEEEILQKKFPDSLFLGCKMSNEVGGHIVCSGGVVIPNSKKMLFSSHLSHLYNREELFEGFDSKSKEGYQKTFDYKIYEQYIKQGKDMPDSIHTTLIRRLHDHSITDALMEAIEGRKVVAIMGGHSMERSDKFYEATAKISRELTRKGFLMISGGGPGAMEAAHLGAYFAYRTEEEMSAALQILKPRPEGALKGKEYSDWDWLHRAMKVIEQYPLTKEQEEKSKSIGIPTWLYGHEPPAAFATHIAKYFANAVREDGLLAIAKHGVVFAPGSAGTTQEIFQDACQNHYAAYNTDPGVLRYVSPMILFGKEHWTTERPVWDLLKKVTSGRPYGELLVLTDDYQEIVNKIVEYNPENYVYPGKR